MTTKNIPSPTPLQCATVRQLVDELGVRYPGGVLIAGIKSVRLDADSEVLDHHYRGGWHTAFGIAETAAILFRTNAVKLPRNEG